MRPRNIFYSTQQHSESIKWKVGGGSNSNIGFSSSDPYAPALVDAIKRGDNNFIISKIGTNFFIFLFIFIKL